MIVVTRRIIDRLAAVAVMLLHGTLGQTLVRWEICQMQAIELHIDYVPKPAVGEASTLTLSRQCG